MNSRRLPSRTGAPAARTEATASASRMSPVASASPSATASAAVHVRSRAAGPDAGEQFLMHQGGPRAEAGHEEVLNLPALALEGVEHHGTGGIHDHHVPGLGDRHRRGQGVADPAHGVYGRVSHHGAHRQPDRRVPAGAVDHRHERPGPGCSDAFKVVAPPTPRRKVDLPRHAHERHAAGRGGRGRGGARPGPGSSGTLPGGALLGPRLWGPVAVRPGG